MVGDGNDTLAQAGERWIAAPGPLDGGGMRIRVTPQANGRRLITGVYVFGPEVTASVLQEVPVSRLDLYLNLSDRKLPFLVTLDEISRLGDMGLTAHEAKPGMTVEDLEALNGSATLEPLTPSPRPKREQLTRPGKNTDPAVFYAKVAEIYREYALLGHAPAVRMHEEADVPVTTVHRWVREARRRGFLPPGRKGKAG
jgi:hypothetical protein